MKKIYFIRHGESELNVAKLWAGHTDTPLTEHGRLQAQTAGAELREQGTTFDVVLSSPLLRAHHTAQHIAEEIGYPLEKIEIYELLKERNFGALEGKDVTVHFSIPLERYIADPYAIDHLEDVETIEMLHERAKQILNEINNRPEKTILLVSHGALGRALQRAVADLPLETPIDQIPNARVFRLI